MTRIFQTAVLGCALLALTGCNSPEENNALWQQVKIGELAPPRSGKTAGTQLLKTIDFSVYIFEVPAENIDTLDDIWQMLYTTPVRFNNYDAFSANSFSAGLGQISMWNKIHELLLKAGGKKTETVSLLLFDGQANDLTIARLDREKSIFYAPAAGSMEGANIGPGRLALQIKAKRIPGRRGVCDVSILPVFSPSMISSIPQLAAREKAGRLFFNCCRFELRMSPGDFVLLGPGKYTDQQITLAGLLFVRPPFATGGRRPDRKPVVRTYLLVCTRIND